jgi:hypothetical protein
VGAPLAYFSRCLWSAVLLLLLQVWLPELGFRLRRLRMMYPDFVTE